MIVAGGSRVGRGGGAPIWGPVGGRGGAPPGVFVPPGASWGPPAPRRPLAAGAHGGLGPVPPSGAQGHPGAAGAQAHWRFWVAGDRAVSAYRPHTPKQRAAVVPR